MKKLIILFLMPTSLYANDVDKILHLTASWALTHATYAICKKITQKEKACLVAAVGVGIGAGVAKEVYDGDNNNNSEHLKDLGADAIGVGGAALAITISF